MQQINQASHSNLLPHQVFDLICGSSTGGIVALLLGRFGLSCTKAIQLYRSFANEITGGNWNRFQTSAFDQSVFERALNNLILACGKDTNPSMILTTGIALQGTQVYFSIRDFKAFANSQPFIRHLLPLGRTPPILRIESITSDPTQHLKALLLPLR